jgi:hypothetical protein
MLRKMSPWLAVVLLCGIGHAGMSTRADELPKTGGKRDTLLYVRTDPPGAKVLLNGKELGTSNGLFPVESGTGTILVELEGRKLGARQVIIRANGITRVELRLKSQAETAGARFIGRLPQGTVELVGITDYPPTDQSRWWQPDGSAAHLDSLFEPNHTRLRVLPGEKSLTFLVHVRNLPADASWPAWKLDPPRSWEGDSVVDVHGNTVPNYYMVSAELGTTAATVDFRVGVGMGDWETVIRQKADSAGTSSFSRDGRQWTVTFQKATAEPSNNNSTQVRLTTTEFSGQWNRRLVAVAGDGSEHESWLGYMGENGEAVFHDLPLSGIREFCYQVRPYYWVEFKNVAIESGQKTDAKVVSLDALTSPGDDRTPMPQDK